MAEVLIPFLAGLLFGPGSASHRWDGRGLNPLFGGSAFRTFDDGSAVVACGLNPLFGGSAFRTPAMANAIGPIRLNPLFGGSAFRTQLVERAKKGDGS